MSSIKSIGMIATVMFLLMACTPAPQPSPQERLTELPATATATVSAFIAKTPTVSPEIAHFPLSAPGPYAVGLRTYAFTDPKRDGRQVSITVWYPSVQAAGANSKDPARNADPDPGGAPYPLILSSTKVADIFAPYLVSHGFTWASVDKIDYYYQMNSEMIDQPRDILFALNQVASTTPNGLDGIIDSEHVGVSGYSFDGYNTLALSGARIDPEYYLAQCPNPDPTTKAILGNESAFGCGAAGAWDKFTAHAGQAITISQDGLWQPMTDERIRAVMPLAGEGWWLFGKRGLATVDRPTLMIVATHDGLYAENALIFEHIGTPDKTLISFIGPSHMMIYDKDMVARMAHFMVAFFGCHLQGNNEIASYFSEDFVAQFEDLAWGVYEE
jgi:predicted dienelactone hydrolase